MFLSPRPHITGRARTPVDGGVISSILSSPLEEDRLPRFRGWVRDRRRNCGIVWAKSSFNRSDARRDLAGRSCTWWLMGTQRMLVASAAALPGARLGRLRAGAPGVCSTTGRAVRRPA